MTHAAPAELVERALEASTADDCVVVWDATSNANLRWANNTLTTNGVTTGAAVTVVSTHAGTRGTAAGVVRRSATSVEDVLAVVAQADAAAKAGPPAEDAAPLVPGEASDDFTDPVERTDIGAFDVLAPRLGEALDRARGHDRVLYGFVEHELTTTYVGSSTGLRRRHVQPGGHIGVTAKSADLARSAWAGRSTRDFHDVDPLAMEADLAQRLAWAERTVELEAGRYDTVLPPTTVADLMIYAYWCAGGRDAHDGQTVFSSPGGGTRVGERLSSLGVNLWSDPHAEGLQCAPFVIDRASGGDASVFDTGLDLDRTSWIADGRLEALTTSRHTAATTGLPLAPAVGNLLMDVDGASGSTADLVAGVERGLLLTSMWYIREVDPQNLLLTGLTRDGVYLVEGGEVTGAVNNFRYNESPVDLLSRITAAGAAEPSFSREWGDYFLRTSTPALRIADFNMSSVSQAS